MATAAGKESSSIEFPGRAIYVRTTTEDVQSPGHQARVENWIQDFEKSRQIFVFPVRPIRAFAATVFVVGLISLVLQVSSPHRFHEFTFKNC